MISGKTIYIVDASVLLVILKVPEHYTDEQYEETISKLRLMGKSDDLLLPIGSIVETGNHIADSKNGRRHPTIKRFTKLLNDAIARSRAPDDRSKGPFCILKHDVEELSKIAAIYENGARDGKGMADTMCIHYFNQQRMSFPDHRIIIWSYDRTHLRGYDTHPD